MDDRLTPEELQMVLEAREAKEKESREKGAAELFTILDTPQANAGMSQRFELDVFGKEADSEDEQE